MPRPANNERADLSRRQLSPPPSSPPMSDGDSPSPANALNNSSSDPHDTGYTFTNDPWIRWRNTFRYLTGQLTEEGNRQYRKGRDDRFAAADCKSCEDQRDYLLQYSTYYHPSVHLSDVRFERLARGTC